MKLSVEQLQKIDTILEKLGLDFLDFKLEIKDHIATQTENLMEDQNLSFEDSFVEVLKDWQPYLRLGSSIWISNKRSFPRIVIDGIKKRYFIYGSIAIAVAVVFFVLHYFYFKKFENPIIHQTVFGINTVLLLVLSVFKYQIYKNKAVTSFSYEFNRIYKMTVVFWVFDLFFYQILQIYLVIFWKILLLTYIPIAIISYYKHQKFINSYYESHARTN